MKTIITILLTSLFSALSFGQVNQYDRPASTSYRNTYVPMDFNSLYKLADAAEARKQREEQIQKEKITNSINQVKSYYGSASTFPDIIKDGWHNVISTNNYDFCEERKVYVLNNKVVKYVIDDWMERKISYQSVITKAKAMIQTIQDDGSKSDMLDLYFIEDIGNPNNYVSPPLIPGKVCFWTNVKKGGEIKVFIEDRYYGSVTSYFSDEDKPTCAQYGTLVFEYKPGVYSYKAYNDKRTWSGFITITSDACKLECFNK